MSAHVCDVCPHTEPDCGFDCGCAPNDHRSSSERNMNHMLDAHREYVTQYKARGLPPDAMEEPR
jgi:hypothetical protein